MIDGTYNYYDIVKDENWSLVGLFPTNTIHDIPPPQENKLLIKVTDQKPQEKLNICSRTTPKNIIRGINQE